MLTKNHNTHLLICLFHKVHFIYIKCNQGQWKHYGEPITMIGNMKLANKKIIGKN